MTRLYDQYAPFFKNLAIVGFLVSKTEKEDEVILTKICWHAYPLEGTGLGEVFAAGSGTALLRQLATAKMVDDSAFSFFPKRIAAIAKVLSVCGHLLSEERKTQAPIVNYSTGGAYEVAYFDGVRFIKPEITFATWEMNVVDGILQVADPSSIIKSTFRGNAHLINCLRNVPQVCGDKPFWQPDLHATFPIFEPPGSVERFDHPGAIGYESPLTQHQVSVFEEGRLLYYYSFVETGTSDMRVDFSEGVRIAYAPKFIEKLTGAVFAV